MIPAIPHIAIGLPSTPAAAAGSRQHLEVLVALPVSDRRQVALPLVALVPVEHLVKPTGYRALDHLILRQGLERVAEAVWHLLDLDPLLQQLVGVALLRRPWIELTPHAVEARLEQRGDGQVGVARGVHAAVLEPA